MTDPRCRAAGGARLCGAPLSAGAAPAYCGRAAAAAGRGRDRLHTTGQYQAGWLAGWLADWLAGWLFVCLTVYLSESLRSCVYCQIFFLLLSIYLSSHVI